MKHGYALLQGLLVEVGAHGTRHSGRTLAQHLLGTHQMLAAAGVEDEICLAGGLHSIYGTDVFRVRSLQESARPTIAKLFGQRAEELAWLFGHMRNRTRSIERGVGDEAGARALRLMEAANILEQGGSLANWPNIQAAWEQQKGAAP